MKRKKAERFSPEAQAEIDRTGIPRAAPASGRDCGAPCR